MDTRIHRASVDRASVGRTAVVWSSSRPASTAVLASLAVPTATGAQVATPPDSLGATIIPQGWFHDVLSKAVLGVQLYIVDHLLGAATRVPLYASTAPALTFEHAAVRDLHSVSLALAGSLLGILVLAAFYSVMVRHTGLGGLTPQQLTGRVIIVAGVLATARDFWIKETINLNNAICQKIAEFGGGTLDLKRLYSVLLGLDEKQQAALDSDLAVTGTAISKALLNALIENGATAQASHLAGFLLLMMAILLVLLALQFLLRLVFLNLMIVIAPVMLVLGVLPSTAHWAWLWVRWFFPTVFLQALQLLILVLCQSWLTRAGAAYGLTEPSSRLLIPLLMALSSLYLTLKAPSILGVAYQGALTSASSFRGAGSQSLQAIGAARGWWARRMR